MAYAILGTPKPAFFDTNGDPLVSGTLEIRDPTTGSLKAYYPTFDDAEASTNGSSTAITLDSRGEPTATQVWGQDDVSYRAVLKDSAAATVYTIDDILMPSSLTQANIGSTLWPQTTAESNQSVTPTNYFYEPGNVLRYGAVRDSANNDSAAFQAAIDQATETNGAEVFVPPGDYHITTTLTITSRDVKIRGTAGSTLQWNGSAANSCLEIGDGASTVIGTIIEGLTIQDETGNTLKLVNINKAHRGTIKDLYLFASTIQTVGVGLYMEESWIWDIYQYRTNNLNIGFKSDTTNAAGVNAVSMHGCQIENFNTYGIHLGYCGQFNLFGGTIENGEDQTADGIFLEADAECGFYGVYFENNNWDIDTGVSTGGAPTNVMVSNCYFAGSANERACIRVGAISTVVNAIGNNVRGNNFVMQAVDGAKYFGVNNQVTEALKTEVVGNAVITGITIDNPGVVTQVAHGFENGSRIYMEGIGGTVELNDRIQVVANKTADTYEIENTTGYTTWTSLGEAYHSDDVMWWRMSGDGYFHLQGNRGIKRALNNIVESDGDTGGTGSAGAGNQYIEIDVDGTIYKVLHDGTV